MLATITIGIRPLRDAKGVLLVEVSETIWTADRGAVRTVTDQTSVTMTGQGRESALQDVCKALLARDG